MLFFKWMYSVGIFVGFAVCWAAFENASGVGFWLFLLFLFLAFTLSVDFYLLVKSVIKRTR